MKNHEPWKKSYTQDPSLRNMTWGKIEPMRYEDDRGFPVVPITLLSGILCLIVWSMLK